MILAVYWEGIREAAGPQYLPWAKVNWGFDGLTCFKLGPRRPAEPYTETLSRWPSFIREQEGFFHIPCASTGFDNRPWYRITWGWQGEGVNDTPYNTEPTLQAFADHLRTVKDYLDTHSSETSKTLIVYAWNEWGESTGVEPNHVDGYQYLDTMKNVFGLSEVIDRNPP